MADMFPGSPRQMQAEIARLERRVAELEAASKEMSLAASELKNLESSGLDANALSDAWDNAYAWLYRANTALKALLGEGENGG